MIDRKKRRIEQQLRNEIYELIDEEDEFFDDVRKMNLEELVKFYKTLIKKQ